MVADNPNPAVSTDLLLQIKEWGSEGATVEDICTRLRHLTVPEGYGFHTRIPGIYQVRGVMRKHLDAPVFCMLLFYVNADKTETSTEMLRAILAQREFTYVVNEWHREGVPFRDHLYVPEVHPDTGVEFCEREDEGHVFKVSS